MRHFISLIPPNYWVVERIVVALRYTDGKEAVILSWLTVVATCSSPSRSTGAPIVLWSALVSATPAFSVACLCFSAIGRTVAAIKSRNCNVSWSCHNTAIAARGRTTPPTGPRAECTVPGTLARIRWRRGRRRSAPSSSSPEKGSRFGEKHHNA